MDNNITGFTHFEAPVRNAYKIRISSDATKLTKNDAPTSSSIQKSRVCI